MMSGAGAHVVDVEEGDDGESVIHVKRGFKIVEVEEEDDDGCCNCLFGPNDSGASTFRASTMQMDASGARGANAEPEVDEFSAAIQQFQAWLREKSAENSRFMNKATEQVENMLLSDRELMR